MNSIEENRGFFGIIIPAEIVDSAELTVSEKFIFGFIASFQKACFLSNETISVRTGVSERAVSRAISNLEKMGYLFVEFAGNNSAKRRIYSVFDNPKKLAYLAKKGMFGRESKPVENSNEPVEKEVSQIGEGRQNGEGGRQNGEPQNGGEGRQIGYHRYRRNIEESGQALLSAPRPLRKDYQTQEEYEQALYGQAI